MPRLFHRLILIFSILLAWSSTGLAGETSAWQQLMIDADKVSVQGHQSPERIRIAQDSAISLALLAFQSVMSATTPDGDAFSTVQNHLGQYYFRKGDRIVADSLWRIAYEHDVQFDSPRLIREQNLFCLGLSQLGSDNRARENSVFQRAAALLDSVLNISDTSAVSRSWRLVNLCYRLGLYFEMDKFAWNAWHAYSIRGGDAYSAMRALIHEAEQVSKIINSNTPNARTLQDSAVSLGKAALLVVEEAYGPTDTNVAFVLQRLGDYEMRQGSRSSAMARWERAWLINEQYLPAEHIEYQGSVSRMAGVFRSRGEYLEAERLSRMAVELRAQTQGPDHPETAAMYMNLGNLNRSMGKHTEAGACFREALKIRQRAIEQIPEDLADCYSQLGNLASDQGDFITAERSLQTAYSTCRRSLGGQHLYTLNVRQQLVHLYRNWGSDSIAAVTAAEVLAQREQFLGRDHPGLIGGMLELAQLCTSLQRFARADSLCHRVDEIVRHSLDTGSIAYAQYLESRGRIELSAGRTAEAEQSLRRSLTLSDALFGESDLYLLSLLTSLGAAQSALGKASEAEASWRRAETIVDQHASSPAISLTDALDDLSSFALTKGDSKRAFSLARAAFDRRITLFRNGARMLSEREAIRFQQRVLNSRDLMIQACLSRPETEPSQRKIVADAIVATKGWVTGEMFWRERILAKSKDPTLLSLVDTLQSERTRLAALYLKVNDSPAETGALDSISAAVRRIAGIESQIARRSLGFRVQHAMAEATCDSVRSWLPAGSVLVEYFRYDKVRQDTSSQRYGVLCVTRDTSVVADLGSVGRIDSVISGYRCHLEEVIESDLLPTAEVVLEYRRLSSELYDLLWSKTAHFVEDNDMVFIAPDAQIHSVAFAGLPRGNGYLIESHAIQYVSSGRALKEPPRSTNTGLLALGDPDFDKLPEASSFASRVEENVELQRDPVRGPLDDCTALQTRRLVRLRGSRVEVEQAAELWHESTAEPVLALTGADASEENLRALAPQSRLLHIATHAYVIDTACKEVAARILEGEHGMLTSGLFLSGAKLKSKDVPTDGVLSAIEVSTLDLREVQVVVLSGCRTAQGSIDAEGVAGLIRSFLMAGAKTVIGSLWPVGDNASADFILSLYRRPDLPLPQAMQLAACDQLHKLRQRGQPDHPALWAPFIATGDWRPLR